MRRLVKSFLAGIAVIALLSFFFFAPVIGFYPPTCTHLTKPSYESLSFHFFNMGEVYLFGQFTWMAGGFLVPLCAG